MTSMTQQYIVSPSLLACDFGRLADEIRQAEAAGADWFHVDVMDGHFVPNLTLGPVIVEAVRKATRKPVDVHLMLDHPERYIAQFRNAGADLITVHVEAQGLRDDVIVRKTLDAIRRGGARPGLSARPRTTAESLKPFLNDTDLLLVMTVEPGFGGQSFIPEVVAKVRQLRGWFGGDISVDGGINAATGRQCREAGANVFVAGTYVFRSESYRDAIASLKS